MDLWIFPRCIHHSYISTNELKERKERKERKRAKKSCSRACLTRCHSRDCSCIALYSNKCMTYGGTCMDACEYVCMCMRLDKCTYSRGAQTHYSSLCLALSLSLYSSPLLLSYYPSLTTAAHYSSLTTAH